MNLERIKKREQRELKESAPYEVWKWMQRQATREYMLNLKFGIKKPMGERLSSVPEYCSASDSGKTVTETAKGAHTHAGVAGC